MKRRIGAILLCIMLALGLTAHADNSGTITQLPGDVPINVQAIFVPAEEPNFYEEPMENGAYLVEAEEGNVALIPAEPNADYTLAVRFFTKEHTDALGWFDANIDGFTTEDSMPFEIYYIDNATGQRVELSEEDEVRIKVAAEDLKVYRLTSDGKVQEITNAKTEGGYLTFKPGGSKCFFALAKQVEEPTPEPKPEEPTPEPKPEEPTPEPEQKPEQKPESDNKDTGDHFDLILWISVMVASASAIAILMILRKKSKEE